MRILGIAIDIAWPLKHHQGILRGILEAARERGWSCILDPFLGDRREAGAIRYDGVIARATRRLAERVRRARIPTVNVWVNSPDSGLPRVVPDQAAAGRLAARHLLDRGFRKFGFLGHPRDRNSHLQLEGFRNALGRAGFPCGVAWVRHEPASASQWRGVQGTLEAWVRSWSVPFGVFAADDLTALILAEACRRRGLRLPDDAGLVGCGNQETVCEMMQPTLSSVEPGYERVGRGAVELLEGLLRGKPPPAMALALPPSGIVERGSTDVFAVEDRDVARALRAIADLSARPLRVPRVVEATGMSRRSLERRFSASLGRTLGREIERAHVARAKRLLAADDLPLKQVAARSGFRSPQQLSRVFRRSEGTTPLAFRRRHRRG